jgi:hypothetical protein
LAETSKEYTISVEVTTENGESDLRRTLKGMEAEFGNVTFTLKVDKRELIPLETIVDVTLRITSSLAAAIFLKMLEKLWQDLKKNKLVPRTAELDGVQSFAEKYLESIRVTGSTLLRRNDKGLYVRFTFRDSKRVLHILDVTSFEPQIVKYERRK